MITTSFLLLLIYRALAKLCNERKDDWDEYLDPTLFSLRTKRQTTTKEVEGSGDDKEFALPREQDVSSYIKGMSIIQKQTTNKVVHNVERAQERQKAEYARRRRGGGG